MDEGQTMDHRTMRDQIMALCDGELAGSERQAADAHLSACAECREWVAQWTRTSAVLFRAPAVAPSEVFVERVMRRIAAPRPRSAPSLTAARWLMPFFGAVAAMTLAVMFVPQGAISVDTLLLSDARDSSMLGDALTADQEAAEDMLAMLMEDTL